MYTECSFLIGQIMRFCVTFLANRILHLRKFNEVWWGCVLVFAHTCAYTYEWLKMRCHHCGVRIGPGQRQISLHAVTFWDHVHGEQVAFVWHFHELCFYQWLQGRNLNLVNWRQGFWNCLNMFQYPGESDIRIPKNPPMAAPPSWWGPAPPPHTHAFLDGGSAPQTPPFERVVISDCAGNEHCVYIYKVGNI